MIRFFLLTVLMACASSSIAADLNEPVCNARKLIRRTADADLSANKSNPLFSSPSFEKDCYMVAKKLIRSATGFDSNLDETEGILETMFLVNPESAYPRMGKAELQMKKRELNLVNCTYCVMSRIYEDAEMATRIKPVLSESFVTLGRVELMMNCPPCAELAVKKARELGNSGPELVMLESSIDEAHSNYRDAKAKLGQALSIPSAELTKEVIIDIHLRLSSLSAILKDNADAEKELNKAVATDPENPIPYIALAEFYLFRLGDDVAATKAAFKANQVKPTIEAKRLLSFSEYLTWAKDYSGGGKEKNIKRIMQTSFVSPEEVFVYSAKHVGLSRISEAMMKAKVINDIEVLDGRGNTALIAASAGNNIKIAQLLISQHANVDAQNSSGERALSLFVLNGNHNAITMILNAGAAVNYVDVNGNTPLSLAAFRQDKLVIDQLLNHGASVQPLIDLAKRLGIVDIERFITNLKPASI